MTSPLYQNKGLLKNTQTALRVFTDSFPLDATELRMSFKVFDRREDMTVLDQMLAANEQQNSQPTEVCLYLDTPWSHIQKIIVSCEEPLQVYPAEVPKFIQLVMEGAATLAQ